MRDRVPRSPEFERIVSLPRRGEHAELVEHGTAWFKTAAGTMSLRPRQALALLEAGQNGGLFAPLGVGEGKTILSLLLPAVFEAKRPVLVAPAALGAKTARERAALAVHWRIPTNIRIFSYELLGRVQTKTLLEDYRPDLIVFDECHYLKNPKAAVTRKVKRYVKAAREGGLCPELVVCAMSGTITNRSLADFAHILEWCLPGRAPLPSTWAELERWRLAVDNGVNPLSRIAPGALLELDDVPSEPDETPVQIARAKVGRRIVETPGIVSSGDNRIGQSISIDEFRLDPPPGSPDPLESFYRDLREAWRLPDGWELVDGIELSRAALAGQLGYFGVWDPRPPQKWLDARSAWGRFYREKIKESRGGEYYDSEFDVRRAFGHTAEWQAWEREKANYRIEPRPVPITDAPAEKCANWLHAGRRRLLWTAHVPFGARLSELAGIPYFGPKGLDKERHYIEDWDGPAIVSIRANCAGRNLQFKWSENLIVSPMASGETAEQLLGRTHRELQTEDHVSAWWGVGCYEAAARFWAATESSRYIQATARQSQKLMYADVTMPDRAAVAERRGPRWIR